MITDHDDHDDDQGHGHRAHFSESRLPVSAGMAQAFSLRLSVPDTLPVTASGVIDSVTQNFIECQLSCLTSKQD
eukprot:461758-Rhodomonas_salina.1